VKNKLKQFYPVFIVTLVVLVSVSLLALTDKLTSVKIEEETEHEIQGLLSAMFPEMNDYQLVEDVYVILNETETIGYAYIAEGKGYGGTISILVGLKDETTVRGISIISHSESPGLGARITEESYFGQYRGISIIESDIKANGGTIDAITGATISSQAVADAVRETALERVKALFGEGGD
jgi:electron transport complex protein RnfG